MGISHERVTPLMVACENGRLDVVQYLIDRGVDPSASTPTGLTPLIAACQSDRAQETVSLLVSTRVDPCRADGHGYAPLWVACRNGDLSLVR